MPAELAEHLNAASLEFGSRERWLRRPHPVAPAEVIPGLEGCRRGARALSLLYRPGC
jgi:hypothetical protein